MLEELYWETSFSGYGFYDYMSINKEFLSQQNTSAKDLTLNNQFTDNNTGGDSRVSVSVNKTAKSSDLSGSVYSNSIHMDDSIANPSNLNLGSFELLPIYAELNDIDESFTSFKGLSGLFSKFSNVALGSTSSGVTPRSYASVFNHFRSDYEDFT